MKTIGTFSKPEEAHLLRMRLESVGIPAFVHYEHMIQMDWRWSNAIGGVHVRIAAEDVIDARDFLAADTGVEGNSSDVLCPVCGSDKTSPDDVVRRFAYFSIFFPPLMLWLAPPLLFILWRRYWCCNSCHAVWRPDKASFWPK